MKAQLCAAALLLALSGARAAAPPEEPPAPAEPVVQRQVAEDDNVRIEELRVRGQTQSITVKSKIRGLRPYEYEIVPPSGARDPSQTGATGGQRLWHFLSF